MKPLSLDRRLFVASSFLLPAILPQIAVAQPAASFEADLNRIQKRLASFFERVDALSEGAPPPGMNASNGYFVNGMLSDGQLDVAQRPIQTDTADGLKCAELTLALMRATRNGFSPGLHRATGLTNLRLATQVFNAALPSVLMIAAEIVAAVYTGGAAGAAISADVESRISSLGDAVKGRGIVTNGEHANGWISVGVRDNANAVMGQIDAAKGSLNADARDYLEILKVLLGKMAALNTAGHDPWLKAEWQLSFTAIALTGAEIMRNPPD